jgi:hypothetical protein
VIALGRGGALEIVREKCGVLYQDPSEAGLEDALRAFDLIEPSFNPLYLRTSVAEFAESVFERNFGEMLTGLLGFGNRRTAPKTEFTSCLQGAHDTRSAKPI